MHMTNDLRVLHVIGGLQCGGAEALLYRLATRKSRVTHEIVSLGKRDWYSPLLEQHGIEVHHFNIESLRSALGALRGLEQLIARSGADVIQSWMYMSNVVAGVLARPHIPVVWGIHTSTFDGTGLSSRIAARIGGACAPQLSDFVINCSSRSAEMHARLGYSRVPGAVIHNGYDPCAFFPDEDIRSAVRAQLEVADDCFVIGCVARWNAQKDIPNLLAAMSDGKRAGLPFIYVLAGRGLDWQNRELVRCLNDSQCVDIVCLLGERSDIPDLMRAFDLHVLPSCGGEAFPNAVAESMLSATPNVVTDTGDAATIVGDAGWVVQPRDSKGLAHAMRDAFNEYRNNPFEWQQRRMAARARVAERYTFESMAEAYENVWRQAVLNARRSYKRKRQGSDEAVAAIDHDVR